jgi:hypothetical protein
VGRDGRRRMAGTEGPVDEEEDLLTHFRVVR